MHTPASSFHQESCTCKDPLPMSTAPSSCGVCGGRFEPTYDPTRHPDVDELPAQTTTLTKDQFDEWLQAPGDIYIVYLPRQKSFIIKVPEMHSGFFVAMLTQLQKALGPEVQAVRASVAGPPGKAVM